MYVYVGYILGDYEHAIWMSASKVTIEKAIEGYKKDGGRRPTWIERYKVTNGLIELDCS